MRSVEIELMKYCFRRCDCAKAGRGFLDFAGISSRFVEAALCASAKSLTAQTQYAREAMRSSIEPGTGFPEPTRGDGAIASHADRDHPLGLGVDGERRCRKGYPVRHAAVLAMQSLHPFMCGEPVGQGHHPELDQR